MGQKMVLKELLLLGRPKHWVKNVVVLFPTVFARKWGDPAAWSDALWATLAFCLASSLIYILNDIRDADRDRAHPAKKNRPLAAGQVSVGQALSMAFCVAAGAIAVSVCMLNTPAMIAVGAYVLLQILYTFVLKNFMLIDVIGIALGFVLRAAGGALAITVAISPWLFICTFTLCLFMGFCKRCNEVVTLGDVGGAVEHRKILIGYTPALLTHLITLSASIAVLGFLMYASSPSTIANFGEFGSTCLLYTLPLVVYAVFRVAMLSMSGAYSDPTDVLTRDHPFQATIVLWCVCSFCLLAYADEFQKWLGVAG